MFFGGAGGGKDVPAKYVVLMTFFVFFSDRVPITIIQRCLLPSAAVILIIMIAQIPSSPVQGGSSRVFDSELPSECNLYLSSNRCKRRHHSQQQQGKSLGNNATSVSVPIMNFATERHSVALMQDINRLHERDSYSLSSTRLPQLKSATKKKTTATTKKNIIVNEPESSVDTCLAHSSLLWRDNAQELSMEVYAMMRTNEKQESFIKEQLSFDVSASHQSHVFSEAGKSDAGRDGRRISMDASTIISAASTLKNDFIAEAEKFYLLVKMKEGSAAGILSEKQVDSSQPVTSSSQTSFKESIPLLDLRPILVHAAEIHAITSTTGESHLNIGIFVASVNDNKLRLFMAQREDMQSWKRPNKIGGTKNDSRCFAPITLNDTTSSSSETQGLETHDEHSTDNPLVFSAPIMALDSYITEEECRSHDGETIAVKMNRLAVACYDGTVRILTYRMINKKQDKDDGNDCPYQFCTLRCSRFIVDGPVVSLQFGVTNCAPRLFSLLETPSLFLVAGSLCGFACIFYEALLPPSSNQSSKQSAYDRFFDGPLLVVDGLDDGQHEGNVDCVTVVHVSNYKTQQVIMVGTQSGRVLVLRQCDNERMAWKRMEDEVFFHRQEIDELQCQIDQRAKQISLLETEKECMVVKVHLNTTTSVMQTKRDDLSQSTSELVKWNVKSDIGYGTNLVAESKESPVEEKSIDCVKDEAEIWQSQSNNNAVLDSPTPNSESNINTHETIMTATTEMAQILLEQGIAGLESNISELSADLIDLEKRRADLAEKAGRLSESLLHSINLRKFYCYESMRETHFPYPIHGIASGHRAEGDVESGEIFVTTMKSFHVCLLDEADTK